MVHEIMTFRVCQNTVVPFPTLWSDPSTVRELGFEDALRPV